MPLILHLSLPVDDLEAARAFYVNGLGCRLGRVRDDWFDVWFFGLLLTLQLRPDEVRPVDAQGTRHFGVVLDADDYASVLDRIERHGVMWLAPPVRHDGAELSGKVGGKLADPAGNVIEIKHYPDPASLRADGLTP